MESYALKLVADEAFALERRTQELRRQADPREVETFDALMNKAEGVFEAARGLRAVEALLQAKAITPPAPFHYVTEKLPEPGQQVLFFSTAGSSHIGLMTNAGDWFVSGGQPVRRERVYAWQPAPEPPPLPEDGR